MPGQKVNQVSDNTADTPSQFVLLYCGVCGQLKDSSDNCPHGHQGAPAVIDRVDQEPILAVREVEWQIDGLPEPLADPEVYVLVVDGMVVAVSHDKNQIKATGFDALGKQPPAQDVQVTTVPLWGTQKGNK